MWVLILVVLMVDKWFDNERKKKKKILVEGGDLIMTLEGRRRSYCGRKKK